MEIIFKFINLETSNNATLCSVHPCRQSAFLCGCVDHTRAWGLWEIEKGIMRNLANKRKIRHRIFCCLFHCLFIIPQIFPALCGITQKNVKRKFSTPLPTIYNSHALVFSSSAFSSFSPLLCLLFFSFLVLFDLVGSNEHCIHILPRELIFAYLFQPSSMMEM